MLILLLAALGCTSAPAPRPTVLVVSFDTTRADALSCYQEQNHWALAFPSDARPQPSTPVVDGLAADGVRFAWALSHVPTTLSSHTTIFSGRDPHRNAIVRNGYPVRPDTALITERFQGAGWDTVAVVSSSALEHKMGLDRGFRSYRDPGPQPPGGMVMLGADEVTRRALSAVDERPEDARDKPLFLFVHYYDAHMPWFTAPPELVSEFTRPDYSGPVDGTMQGVGFLTKARIQGELRFGDARQARALYLAQVAWQDRQLGVLLDGLRQRGLLDPALVVVLADHGETLDESPTRPYTHGPNTGLVDLHVPLVMWGMGLPSGVTVNRTVRLMDVASTLSSVAGLGTAWGDGQDLSPLWRGQSIPPSTSFAEATRPMDQESTTGWNDLPFERAVADGGYWLRVRPSQRGLATLHRIAPGEPAVQDMARLRDMAELLRLWDAAAPGYRAPEYDDETAAALRALGYLPAQDAQRTPEH